MITQLVKKYLSFMEPVGSFPRSEQPTIGVLGVVIIIIIIIIIIIVVVVVSRVPLGLFINDSLINLHYKLLPASR
jgi:hypothetical protein